MLRGQCGGAACVASLLYQSISTNPGRSADHAAPLKVAEKAVWTAHIPGLCHPLGNTGWSFWLLGSTCPALAIATIGGVNKVDERSLFTTHSLIYTTFHIHKINDFFFHLKVRP